MHRSMCSGSSCYLCSIHRGNSGIIVYGMFYNLIQLYMDNVSNDLNTKQGRNAYSLDYFINGQDSSTYLMDKQSCTPSASKQISTSTSSSLASIIVSPAFALMLFSLSREFIYNKISVEQTSFLLHSIQLSSLQSLAPKRNPQPVC